MGIQEAYLEWPEMAEESVRSLKGVSFDVGKPRSVVYAGMGGSASAGDLLRDWVGREFPIPFTVVKAYRLPKFVGKEDLVLAVSYSGDTGETLSCMREALERGAKVVSISSGGLMEKISSEKGAPHVRLPRGLKPRAALPHLLYSAVMVLLGSGAIPQRSMRSVEASLVALREARVEIASGRGTSRELAEFLAGGTPVIYGSWEIAGVLERFSSQLAENAKVKAMRFELPECCHNEVESIASAEADHRVVLVRIRGEDPEVAARMELLKEMYWLRGVRSFEVASAWEGLFEQMVSLVYLLDFSTIHLAAFRGVDPSGTPYIDRLKGLGKA